MANVYPKSDSIDVYIYVTSKSLSQFDSKIVGQLGTVDGVSGVTVNAKVKDLLAVKYDPDRVTALSLLDVLKQNGHSASLIGM